MIRVVLIFTNHSIDHIPFIFLYFNIVLDNYKSDIKILLLFLFIDKLIRYKCVNYEKITTNLRMNYLLR